MGKNIKRTKRRKDNITTDFRGKTCVAEREMEPAVDPCSIVGFGSLSVVLKLSVLPSSSSSSSFPLGSFS
jgi:hypothetical protein